MELTGHIENGTIIIDTGSMPPDGSRIEIHVLEAHPPQLNKSAKQRIQFPLINSRDPGTIHLTNEQIARIFDEEDLLAGR
jgi:hypothetical protein